MTVHQSDCTIRRRLSQSGRPSSTPLLKWNYKKVRLEFVPVHKNKPQSFKEKDEIRQNWVSFLARQISSQPKLSSQMQITLSLLWNMEEARLCSGAALSPDVLNLCRVWWTIEGVWRKICCLELESLVSVPGRVSANRTKPQNTDKNLKNLTKMFKSKTLNRSQRYIYSETRLVPVLFIWFQTK